MAGAQKKLQFTLTPDFVSIYDDLVWIATINVRKMPQNRYFGAGSDTMQQVHGASVKNNEKNPMQTTPH